MLTALALHLLLTQAARPDGEARARELVARAEKEYALGEFNQALVDYKEAYRLKPLPGLLYNLGQASRQTRDYRQSAFYFSQYLAKTSPDDSNRPLAETLLQEMRRKAADEEAKTEKPKVPGAASLAGLDRLKTDALAKEDARKPKLIEQEGSTSKAKVVGYSLLGASALCLISGGIEGLHYRHLNSALDSRYRSQGVYFQHDTAILSDASAAGKLANGLFLATAVLAAAGAVLVYRF